MFIAWYWLVLIVIVVVALIREIYRQMDIVDILRTVCSQAKHDLEVYKERSEEFYRDYQEERQKRQELER